MRILLIFSLFAVATTVFGAEQTYIREYTYKASDLDSRVTARSNALKLIKTGVLEEIISFVNTSSKIDQRQAGDEFRSSFIHKASSQSAGFLKAKVLKETWDGYELWMKAEIKADPVKVRDELTKSLSMSQRQATSPGSQVPSISPPAQVVIPANPVMQDNSGYILVSKFSQAYSLISPIRIMALQHYSMHGAWPTKLEQIGMSEDDTSDGQFIDKITLGSNGEIVALLSKEFGKKRVLKVSPKSVMGGMNVRWQCYTNLPVKQINMLSNFNCKNDNTL